jgi:hypothetical protein
MRSPAEHYDIADRLLAEASTEHAAVIATSKIARAHVHALLAQVRPRVDQYDAATALACMVAGNGLPGAQSAVAESAPSKGN